MQNDVRALDKTDCWEERLFSMKGTWWKGTWSVAQTVCGKIVDGATNRIMPYNFDLACTVTQDLIGRDYDSSGLQQIQVCYCVHSFHQDYRQPPSGSSITLSLCTWGGARQWCGDSVEPIRVYSGVHYVPQPDVPRYCWQRSCECEWGCWCGRPSGNIFSATDSQLCDNACTADIRHTWCSFWATFSMPSSQPSAASPSTQPFWQPTVSPSSQPTVQPLPSRRLIPPVSILLSPAPYPSSSHTVVLLTVISRGYRVLLNCY